MDIMDDGRPHRPFESMMSINSASVLGSLFLAQLLYQLSIGKTEVVLHALAY